MGVSYYFLRFMFSLSIIDVPNERSSHTMPTPTAGGVSVAIPFLLSIAVYEILFQFSPPYVTALLTGSLLMVIKGFWDDIRGLRWGIRLILQIAVTTFIVMSGVYISSLELPFIGPVSLGIFGPVISILAIVAFINLFNFIDGLNGLMSGVTLIGLFFYNCSVWVYLHPPFHAGYYTFFCSMVLMFSLVPFFIYNFPKGKIFMGDAGSQFLGFVLPVLGMLGSFETQQGYTTINEAIPLFPITPLLIMLLFFQVIYDGGFTLLRRLRLGRKMWHADREHLFHKALEAGLTPIQVVLIYFLVAILQGCMAFYFVFYVSPQFFIFSFLPLLILYTFFAVWVFNRIKGKKHA